MLNEETIEMAQDLYNFIKNKYKFDRDPKIKFIDNKENASKILARTGYYNTDNEEVVVYITDRHPKDILRSFAHELIHHIQICEGTMTPDRAAPASDPNYIVHDKYLKKIEGDAFYRGNLTFREWEASKKMNDQNLNEGKSKKKKKKKVFTKTQYKSAKNLARKFEKEQDMDVKSAHRIAYAAKKKQIKKNKSLKEGVEDQMSAKNKEVKEIKVNEALKDSPFYVPEDRNNLFAQRDELIYQELLKKFGIKK